MVDLLKWDAEVEVLVEVSSIVKKGYLLLPVCRPYPHLIATSYVISLLSPLLPSPSEQVLIPLVPLSS